MTKPRSFTTILILQSSPTMFMPNSTSSSPSRYSTSSPCSQIMTAANLPSFVSRDAPTPMKGIRRSAFTDHLPPGKAFIYSLSQNREIMALFVEEFDAQYHASSTTCHDGSGIHKENTRPLVGCFNDDKKRKHSHDGSDDFPQPVYQTCQGLHSDLIHPLQCPFEDSSTLLDNDESQKHGHGFDNYPHPHKRTQPTNPFRSSFSEGRQHPVLEQVDLVEQIITHMVDHKFILIEAPPCSGKSMLIQDIAFAVTEQSSAVAIHFAQHFAVTLRPIEGSSDTETLVNFLPTYTHYSPCITPGTREVLSNIRNSTGLAVFLRSEPTENFEYWLFVDESQSTYLDERFWNVLTASYDRKFFVVAAGSYGSHTGSTAHSPPTIIPKIRRMNLFPSPDNNQLCLAFTEQDFDNFAKMVAADMSKWRRMIMDYASPCGIDIFPKRCMHPGVVVELTMHFVTSVKNCAKHALSPPDETKVLSTFFCDCMTSAKSDTPFGLGRCVPHEPSHGFTASSIKDKSIKVRGLDGKLEPVVVTNGPAIWKSKGYSETLRAHQIHPQHLRSQYTDSTGKSTITSTVTTYLAISKYTKEDVIAITPRQRFLNVAAERDCPPDAMPYALRERYNHLPISDFDQAAHDVRRMGWLLQDPLAPNTLVLPTKWHCDYLKNLLKSPNSPEARNMTFDQFLCSTIRHFCASVLQQYSQDGKSMREAIWDSEFRHTAETVGDACFLKPQARTDSGDGTIDFVCTSRKWLIELMRNRDRLSDHLARFTPNGNYGQQWLNWDWRLVDFHFDKTPSGRRFKGQNCPNFRSVYLKCTMSIDIPEDDTQYLVMEAAVSGSSMETETFNITG
ncbi:hypothetical protein BT96DRAFT_950435 [Gymnopus androsaceus JB14]|uniref:Uncharacterized protein n=1 Tax=Gymnopus androsaceus JB14 TaxID=1447944 RepID=A0A6A4GGD2_9AGAR|nr:hypothetical protein BT96DRAFT_950435 [Gymnopus androsaceus JB14]